MIQDYGIEVSTDQSFTGASPDFLPYVASSKTIQIGTLINTLQDIGRGAELVMEFEVTQSFTGYAGAAAIPMIQMCVATGDATLANGVSIIGSCGYPLSSTKVENGFQPSDSLVVPNLYAGDKFYVKLPPFVPGSPWIGSGGVRNNNAVPGSNYLGAYYILPNRTGQAVQMSNPALWTATNFTAGAFRTRILIGTGLVDGKHHYATGMVAR